LSYGDPISTTSLQIPDGRYPYTGTGTGTRTLRYVIIRKVRKGGGAGGVLLSAVVSEIVSIIRSSGCLENELENEQKPETSNTSQMDSGTQAPGILWACVARNDTILCSAPAHQIEPRVKKASHEILRKKATPGFEFYSSNSHSPKLKAIKFHIYEHTEDRDLEATVFRFWVVAAVYDPKAIDLSCAKAFIEKIVVITEVFRENDHNWQYGPEYCIQDIFSPTLQQRMNEVTYLGKMAAVHDEIDSLKQIMARNIDMIIDRGEKTGQLEKESKQLNEMAAVFKKNSKKLKRHMLWQNAKHGLVLGTAITVGVAVVTVPLVALL
jgi:hypothetical protein